uniref:Uncharacterized protein n=1 Tax=Rheinheimera sp. BAL341 TaxID=1708203 RepID=A0A486XV34_9GAMM
MNNTWLNNRVFSNLITISGLLRIFNKAKQQQQKSRQLAAFSQHYT